MTGPPGAVNYPQGMPPGPPANMPIFPAKRESYFPPDSVEAVVPVMAKRRRLCRADMVPVDAWRVYLALKSGLLAESTWAIDVLNVLLYDDSSIHYFSLAYMPGLTEVLLEHFRRCLSQIFTILEDMEIGFDRIEEFKSKLKQRSIKQLIVASRPAKRPQKRRKTPGGIGPNGKQSLTAWTLLIWVP